MPHVPSNFRRGNPGIFPRIPQSLRCDRFKPQTIAGSSSTQYLLHHGFFSSYVSIEGSRETPDIRDEGKTTGKPSINTQQFQSCAIQIRSTKKIAFSFWMSHATTTSERLRDSSLLRTRPAFCSGSDDICLTTSDSTNGESFLLSVKIVWRLLATKLHLLAWRLRRLRYLMAPGS